MSFLFAGINGNVVALDRATGEEVWRTALKGDFVNLALDGGELFAAARGEVYCLDPATGHVRWHNPLKGLGFGMATFATSGNMQAMAREEQDRQRAAAATTGNTAAIR